MGLLSFQGRTSRGGFWVWVVFCLFAQFGLSYWVVSYVADQSLIDQVGSDQAFAIAEGSARGVSLLLALVLLWPSLAVSTRRWHDINMSGAWVLINLVPFLGWIVSLIFNGFVAGTVETNRYGTPPGQPVATPESPHHGEPPDASEGELMDHYGITHENGRYLFGSYAFPLLKTALAHARHAESLRHHV